MLAALERDEFLRDRDRAFAALDRGDYDAFIAMYHRTVEHLGARLDEIRVQALRAHDAAAYDDAARFCLELSHAFHQRRRAYRRIEEAEPGQGQHMASSVLRPLPDILAAVERGDVAAIDVIGGDVDAAMGEEMMQVHLRLHSEAEQVLLAGHHRSRDGVRLGLGLRRALPDEARDELTQRLRRDPITPTRAEVAELLSAVARYNAAHTPPIAVSSAV